MDGDKEVQGEGVNMNGFARKRSWLNARQRLLKKTPKMAPDYVTGLDVDKAFYHLKKRKLNVTNGKITLEWILGK
jgi:hypothetical protein